MPNEQYKKKQKRQKITLFFSYALMTATVALISIVCVFLLLGYRLDLGLKKVEQGALVQFRSQPGGAQIILDGKNLSLKTPNKQDVRAGNHTVTLKLDGYREWTKTFTVGPGELHWLSEARLTPVTIKTIKAYDFTSLSSVSVSRDRKWLMSVQDATKPSLTLLDISDEKNLKVSTLTIPVTAYSTQEGAAHQFSIAGWDASSNYVLIKHIYADKTEFLRISRSDTANMQNISVKLGVSLTDVQFSSSNDTVLYGIENGNLRRLDVANSQLSEPLARGVQSVTIEENGIMSIVQKTDVATTVAQMNPGGTLVQIAAYDNSLPVYVRGTKYYGEEYLVIARGKIIDILKNPQAEKKTDVIKFASQALEFEAAWLDSSSEGRIIIVGNNTQYLSYDLELKLAHAVTLSTAARPTWLDNYTLARYDQTGVGTMDFDGDNQQPLTAADGVFRAILSDDEKYLYSFLRDTASGHVYLQASQIVL